MQYAWHLVCMICIYGVVAESLSLLMGQAGRLSLAHAVFFGTGAYTVALCSTQAGWPFFLSLTAAVLVTALAAAFVALLTARFEAEYFVLVTFAVQLAFSAILISAAAAVRRTVASFSCAAGANGRLVGGSTKG